MRFHKTIKITTAILLATSLIGCSESKSGNKVVDYNKMSEQELIAAAKKEGAIHSVGMPDTWANWVQTWNDLESKYGLKHKDQDMSSAEEIAMFKEEGQNATKDIGDVGQQWGPVATDEKVTYPFKTKYWNEIPDWAKDKDGHWIVDYYGTMTILTNKKLVPNAPKSFKDILKGNYKVTIGDVSVASQAQHAILASAYAFGGSIDNLKPAYDFWSTLAKQGRLDIGETSIARIQKGEISVGMFWDYNALGYRDQTLKINPNAKFEAHVPSDGSVKAGYAIIINKYAPNLASACLTRQYVLSDEGQINLARGYATPIRKVKLPKDVLEKRIPEKEYGSNVKQIDYSKWTKVTKEMISYWQENIIPLLK